jgi:hypothetical protein
MIYMYFCAVDLYVSFANIIIYEWHVDCTLLAVSFITSVASNLATSITYDCCVMPTQLISFVTTVLVNS